MNNGSQAICRLALDQMAPETGCPWLNELTSPTALAHSRAGTPTAKGRGISFTVHKFLSKAHAPGAVPHCRNEANRGEPWRRFCFSIDQARTRCRISDHWSGDGGRDLPQLEKANSRSLSARTALYAWPW